MTDLEKAARQALKALEVATTPLAKDRQEVLLARDALFRALDNESYRKAYPDNFVQPAQVQVPMTDNTYGYAKSLAEAIFKQHFASDEHYASGRVVWGVNDTVIGILTQIDNMVADMVRRSEQPAQQEPVAWRVRWPKMGGGYAWIMNDAPLMQEHGFINEPLYTRPQAREPLSDEQIREFADKHLFYQPEGYEVSGVFNLARAIEAAHGIGEKNG